MIAEIRSYFKARILEVDSELKHHDEYFTSGNIPDLKIESTYFLEFGAFSSTLENVSYTGTFDVSLSLWKNGKKEAIENLDNFYEKSIEIFNNIQAQKNIDQVNCIKAVSGNAITPEPSESNDNLGKFVLQFTVTVGYKVI
jgi:hypothetical protein